MKLRVLFIVTLFVPFPVMAWEDAVVLAFFSLPLLYKDLSAGIDNG